MFKELNNFFACKTLKDANLYSHLLDKINIKINSYKLECNNSEIIINWLSAKNKYTIEIPCHFNFNSVFNKRIVEFKFLFLDKFISFSEKFPSFSFKLCVGDGREASNYSVVFSSNNPKNLLIPDIHYIASNGYEKLKLNKNIKFEDKKNILYWRGNITDIDHKYLASKDYKKISQRLNIVIELKDKKDLFNIKFSNDPTHFDKLNLHQIFEYLQSENLINTEEKLYNEYYKFLLDVDGIVNAWSFLEKMSYNSVILKFKSKNNNKQWFYNRISNNKEYIEITELKDFYEILKYDDQILSNISYNALIFFRNLNFENECKKAINEIFDFQKKI